MGRFQKGQSGNPAGRPRGSQNFAGWLESRDFDAREAMLNVALTGKVPSGEKVTPEKQFDALTWLFKRVEPERRPIDEHGDSGPEVRLVLDMPKGADSR